MRPTILFIATAFALGALAGCDRTPEHRASQTPRTSSTPAPAGTGSSAAPQSNTPTTPANIGQPSPAEKKDGGQPPVQGREDVRQPEQRKDFEHKGDATGPKS